MAILVDAYGTTDQGPHRKTNEDQFLVADLEKSVLIHRTSLPADDHTRITGGPKGHLFVVADGMGGQAGGGVASRTAVETLTKFVLTTLPWFFRLREEEEHDLSDELTAAVKACQTAVRKAADADPARGRMGTTVTLAYVLWPRLYVVHAGDTRAYLLRGGRLQQVTRDHTVAQKMVEAGQMSPEIAEGSRWSHVLYNCVGGGHDDVNPEVYKATLRAGDVLMLCSDGVTNELPDDRIANLLAGICLTDSGGAEAAANALVGAAVAAGGRDNATAVVVRFADRPRPGAGSTLRLDATG
jgi:protein phosphatase